MVSVSGIVSFLAVLFVFVIIIVSFVFNPVFNRGLLSVREFSATWSDKCDDKGIGKFKYLSTRWT